MGRLTESLVRFLCSDALASPPAAAVQTAIDGFTDCVAVMVAGRSAPVSRRLRRVVSARGGPGESRVGLSRERAPAAGAALAGTGAAHALDFDDYAYSNHVSALLVPAILAEADRHGADGADLVAAYLAGFEVWGTVFKREPDHLHSKGWHPTGVFGPLGVAAALARLRRLDPERTRHALGLAAASGGGVMDNFGAEAKPWQGARAAQAGVECVELAAAGLTAGPDALDGSGGLLAALSPAGRVDRASAAEGLGVRWIAAGPSLNLKRHPTVGASQRAIDAAIQLHDEHAPPPGDIARVVARVSEKHAAVMRLHRPKTASEARFSLEFGVAAGLIFGRVGLAELDDAVVGRPDVQALLRKVETEVGPDDDPSYPVGAKADSVRVELGDGSVLESEPVRRFLGHGENPMSEAQLREKFDDCTGGELGEAQGDALWRALRALPGLESTAALPTLRYASDDGA